MFPRDEMLMNWPERVWIMSPVRLVVLRLQARKWLRLTGPSPGRTVLEIGCGPGRGARILAEQMAFARVLAFDLETKLAAKAALRLPVRLRKQVAFFTADAQFLPFDDSRFDAVANFGIIHHVLDWRRCIREISRVLKPGGVFYFEEIYPPLYANFLLKRLVRHPTQDRFDGPQFLSTLSDNGLRLFDQVDTGSKYGIVGAAVKTIHANVQY
jgi:ubiquinone/menaquinone biosynthesis C-methylase UbiE